MIRPFRSIRQELLAQSRITRYLTYAVGRSSWWSASSWPCS
ncbi:MAG: hypothetical protein R2817_07660 [Flavobacteriales bacterium]